MASSPYIIRNYQSADFDNYVLLYQEAKRLQPLGRLVPPKVIAELLKRPNYSPALGSTKVLSSLGSSLRIPVGTDHYM